jgi:ABC-type polysaccharide/polyol phosphate transport system ATPase subunit
VSELRTGALLRANNVSKLYARRDAAMRRRAAQSMTRAFFGGRPPEIGETQKHEFWALRDISFDLFQGEAIGVIGLNGSGKTTLLRILAGQLLPDSGDVEIVGNSAAMIDLTAGFQPAVSGRRNIFLRAAALGYTRRQTLEMYDEIVEFSELGDAIEATMATYSSGMRMRLAFSVMAMVRPDVLLIDEVLAVGDFRFRQKCLSHIRQMRDQSAFVFVSHSMGDVSRFCDRVIVLHKGRAVFAGAANEAIAFYRSLDRDSSPAEPGSKPVMPEPIIRPDVVDDLSFKWLGTCGKDNSEFAEGDPIRLRVSFTVRYKPHNLIVGVPIYDLDGNVISGFATDAIGVVLNVDAGDRVELEMTASSAFNSGRYRAGIGITDGTEFLNMHELSNLVVRADGRKTWGTVTLPYQWKASVTSPVKA